MQKRHFRGINDQFYTHYISELHYGKYYTNTDVSLRRDLDFADLNPNAYTITLSCTFKNQLYHGELLIWDKGILAVHCFFDEGLYICDAHDKTEKEIMFLKLKYG